MLNKLTIDNCNVYLSSKSFEKSELKLVEPWYQTNYSKHKFDPNFTCKCSFEDFKNNQNLMMPIENTYFPSKLDLLTIQQKEVTLLNYPSSLVFHGFDKKFNTPQVYFYLCIYSKFSENVPLVHQIIFHEIREQFLKMYCNEFLYTTK